MDGRALCCVLLLLLFRLCRDGPRPRLRVRGTHRGTGHAASHLCYTLHATAHHQTRVKLNRVFFPR